MHLRKQRGRTRIHTSLSSLLEYFNRTRSKRIQKDEPHLEESHYNPKGILCSIFVISRSVTLLGEGASTLCGVVWHGCTIASSVPWPFLIFRKLRLHLDDPSGQRQCGPCIRDLVRILKRTRSTRIQQDEPHLEPNRRNPEKE